MGSDERIINYIIKFQDTKDFLKRFYDFLKFLIPLYEKRGSLILLSGLDAQAGGKIRRVGEILKTA